MDIAKIRELCESIEVIEESLEDLNTDLLAANDEAAGLKQEIADKLALHLIAMENLKKECGAS